MWAVNKFVWLSQQQRYDWQIIWNSEFVIQPQVIVLNPSRIFITPSVYRLVLDLKYTSLRKIFDCAVHTWLEFIILYTLCWNLCLCRTGRWWRQNLRSIGPCNAAALDEQPAITRTRTWPDSLTHSKEIPKSTQKLLTYSWLAVFWQNLSFVGFKNQTKHFEMFEFD